MAKMAETEQSILHFVNIAFSATIAASLVHFAQREVADILKLHWLLEDAEPL